VTQVLDRSFDGNAKQMASELGIPYLALLRVLHGADPSSRLLSALVDKAHVDAKWLLTGRAVRAKDFGLAGNVYLLPVAPELIAEPTITEVIDGDGPRQPVVSEQYLDDAYCCSIPSGSETTREVQIGVKSGDLILVKCRNSRDEDPGNWDAQWVTFVEPDRGRVSIGRMEGSMLRPAGESSDQFRVGPDDAHGQSGGLFAPRKRSRTKYGLGPDGITTIYRDGVVGRLVARLVWREGFLVPEALST